MTIAISECVKTIDCVIDELDTVDVDIDIDFTWELSPLDVEWLEANEQTVPFAQAIAAVPWASAEPTRPVATPWIRAQLW